jgi:hypothetical protein
MAWPHKEREPGLEIALAAAGGVRPLARLVNRSPATIALWRRIPQEHVQIVSDKLQISRQELRPDIYLRRG